MSVLPPRALVIAGLDPSCGAGLVLDAFVLASLGFAPATVATTVTAQNSAAFLGAEPVSPDLVRLQLEAVLAEGPVACVKVGAVGSADNALAIATALRGLAAGVPVVVDPVLVSSSGGCLTDATALDGLCRGATVVTPNAEEAARLAGTPDTRDLAGAEAAGQMLASRWETSIVVTGLPPLDPAGRNTLAVDLLCVPGGDCLPLSHRLADDVGDVRGTGCMFASSLAAFLGRRLPVDEAIAQAQQVVAELLRDAVPLGSGRMQVDLTAVRRD